jgi:hypothetical protein
MVVEKRPQSSSLGLMFADTFSVYKSVFSTLRRVEKTQKRPIDVKTGSSDPADFAMTRLPM